MESEQNFFPTPEKPKVLYHASSNPDITKFEPRTGKQRDIHEGPQIFATPSKAMATIFMVETDDSWVASGTIDDIPYIIISDRERFEKLDKGGTMYSLPSNTFKTDPQKGLGELEYTSTEAVEPIHTEHFTSALDAMKEAGVKVLFVDKHTFELIQKSDSGIDIEEMLRREA